MTRKVLEEAAHTFANKRDHFEGELKILDMHDDGRKNEGGQEYRAR